MRVVALLAAAGCTYDAPSASPADSAVKDMAVDMPVDMPIDMPPQAFWQNLVGATADGTNLTDSAAGNGWNKSGASTTRSIDGNGYVEFSSAENNLAKICGLSHGDTNQDFKDIDFAVYLDFTSSVQIFEKGISRGVVGSYVPGDRFRVELTGTTVKYTQNGALLFTSTQLPTLPLLGDAAMFHANSTLTDAILVDF